VPTLSLLFRYPRFSLSILFANPELASVAPSVTFALPSISKDIKFPAPLDRSLPVDYGDISRSGSSPIHFVVRAWRSAPRVEGDVLLLRVQPPVSRSVPLKTCSCLSSSISVSFSASSEEGVPSLFCLLHGRLSRPLGDQTLFSFCSPSSGVF